MFHNDVYGEKVSPTFKIVEDVGNQIFLGLVQKMSLVHPQLVKTGCDWFGDAKLIDCPTAHIPAIVLFNTAYTIS